MNSQVTPSVGIRASKEMGPAGAPTLLLLGEAGISDFTWQAVLGPLAEQFRIVLPLDPGGAFPRTVSGIANAAIAALDEAGSSRAHIAGCGLGGIVALWLAIHRPERVSRIAVIGAVPSASDSVRLKAVSSQFRAGEKADAASSLIEGWLTSGLRARDATLVDALNTALNANDTTGLADLYEAYAEANLRVDFGRIAAPTLIVLGEDDPFVSASDSNETFSALPQAKVEWISDAAHLPTLEQPARVVHALLNHFGSAATLESGYRSRRIALGDAHVDKTIAAYTAFTQPFQDFLTRYCWGEVWSRGGLSRRDRSLATIAALVALGAEHEIPIHVRAGLRHGLKVEEFPELYQQLALYTGLPRAFGALNITQKTLLEDGHLKAKNDLGGKA